MFKSLLAFSSLCAVVGIWIGLTSNDKMAGRELRLESGRSTIVFNPAALKDSGIKVDLGKSKACFRGSNPAFRFDKSDLKFRSAGGKFLAFEGGAISHFGGFKLVGANKSVDIDQFRLVANAQKTTELGLTAKSDKGSFVALELARPRDLRKTKKGQVILDSMDVRITKRCAEELGKPELAGEQIGTLSLFAESEATDGGGEVEIPVEAAPSFAPQDVSLQNMSSFSVASNPVGIVGTTPNRTYGFTMLTTSCNSGTDNIPWQSPMQTAHPAIAMNLYRLMNGRFEQVGWSWLKHGFFATNESSCAGGSCVGGGGSILKPFCTDTYATGNNGDRTYLGGRDEYNPLTGLWTCTNSWFSNYQPDCIRRNPGIDPIDAVAHRLVVSESDLGNTGATYYYEAYYITASDANTYNNIASRITSLSWSGTTLNISNSGIAQVQGPAINRWGEMRSTATPQTDGDVIVAVQTTDNGNGTWHYEYALYNHTLDRQVREFSVPVPASATLTNIDFRDIDKVTTNQWTSSFSNGVLKWSTGTFGTSGANPLKYASVFNFRFDANVPPASTTTTLGLFKPGTGTELTAASRGPLVLSDVASVQVTNGVSLSGNQQSLNESDEDRMVISPTSTGQRLGTGVTVSIFAPTGTINSFVVGVESSNTLLAGAGTQTIELWNWNTSAWESVDSRATAPSDGLALVNVSSNPSRFVNASTREVQARILHVANAGFMTNRWRMAFDQIGFHFN